MAIDATPGGGAANSYQAIAEIDARMPGYRNGDLWAALLPPEKERLALMATRVIDRFPGLGPKAADGQRLRFPRASDGAGAMPEAVKEAQAEQVDCELGQLAQLVRLRAEGVTAAGILGQTMSFGSTTGGAAGGPPAELCAGARTLLESLVATGESPDQASPRYVPGSPNWPGDPDGPLYG